MSTKYKQRRRDIPPNVPTGERESVLLVAETKSMERKRRLAEQQGERQFASVKAREHSENESAPASEEGLQNGIMQHPDLNNPRFDGTDSSLNPEPPLNTEARRKFDNERREQDKEKQLKQELRLGLSPKYGSTPKPGV